MVNSSEICYKMEQRIQNLEELCELITKQVVEQNKNIIDVNQNLINEIRSLRAAFVKQDVSFSFLSFF